MHLRPYSFLYLVPTYFGAFLRADADDSDGYDGGDLVAFVRLSSFRRLMVMTVNLHRAISMKFEVLLWSS